MRSFRSAIAAGCDLIECDVHLSSDGRLVVMHDHTLERTTNVAEVFPDRVSTGYQTRQPGKHWLGNDFTMAEIKRLDAGKWFKPEFTGQHIQTFQDAIDLVRGKAGLYPELKSPELYKSRGVDQVKLFVDIMRKNGLEKLESLKTTPVIIQSFDESAIRRVSVDLPTVPRVFLTGKDEDVTEARLKEMFGASAASIRAERRDFNFRYRSPEHFLDIFKSYYGPMLKAFAALDTANQQGLQNDLLALIGKTNRANDGTVVVPSEYLEVVITKR